MRCYDLRVVSVRGWILVVMLGGCVGETEQDGAATTGSESTTSGAPQCEERGWEMDEGAEDTGLGMGDDMPLPITIGELQQGEVVDNVWVLLSGVVVTTPSAVSEDLPGRELFVQDPAGGPFSGMRIVALGFHPDDVLAPGVSTDVVGQVALNEGFVALRVHAMDDVTPHGPAAVPAPTLVEIAELAPTAESARRYEGVLVEVIDATVTDDDPCAGEFVLDDIVRVDDRFAPGQLGARADGEAVAAARGVFVSASGSYELAPPDPSDVE